VLGSPGGEERYQNVSRFELSANGKHWRPSTMRAGEVASGDRRAGHLGALGLEAFGSFLRRLIIIYTERPTGTLAADGIYGWSRQRNDS
jgi:hypothetical protein